MEFPALRHQGFDCGADNFALRTRLEGPQDGAGIDEHALNPVWVNALAAHGFTGKNASVRIVTVNWRFHSLGFAFWRSAIEIGSIQTPWAFRKSSTWEVVFIPNSRCNSGLVRWPCLYSSVASACRASRDKSPPSAVRRLAIS
jgi:hypothetical protein